MRNTIRNVTIVVPVLITSCHVSLKPKCRPKSAHTTIITAARMKVAGRPEMWAVHLVSRVNHVRDLVGLMVAGCYHSVHPSMLLRLRRGLWPPVDPALVDAGREGELAVARTRIAIVVLMALNPAAALIRSPAQTPR